MSTPKINFLQPAPDKKIKPKKVLKAIFYPVIFLFLFILVFSCEILISGEGISAELKKIDIIQNITFGLSNEKQLLGEKDDRINILLLGMGGKGHDGPYLTDTMILASIKPSTHQVSLVSIPRDLSVPITGYGWHKINEANSIGEVNSPGNGAGMAVDTVSKIFDQPIQYYVRVDFSGFAKLIDELGGVNIYVDNSFSDSQFPTDNYGFQTVSFKQGWQTMNGQTALNYARSRHGDNGESSDFARSKRQEKVLAAIKDKALSFNTFLNPNKVSALIGMFQNHIDSNLQLWEIYKLYKLARGIDTKNITNVVLDTSPTSPLYQTTINGAYILLPKDMSYKQLQNVVRYALDPSQSPQQENAAVKIAIQNGTKIEGLAYRTSVELKNAGFVIAKINNADKQTYAQTVIYDLTNGQKNDALDNLKKTLGANLATDTPSWLAGAGTDADFIVIIGQNQQNITKN